MRQHHLKTTHVSSCIDREYVSVGGNKGGETLVIERVLQVDGDIEHGYHYHIQQRAHQQRKGKAACFVVVAGPASPTTRINAGG